MRWRQRYMNSVRHRRLDSCPSWTQTKSGRKEILVAATCEQDLDTSAKHEAASWSSKCY